MSEAEEPTNEPIVEPVVEPGVEPVVEPAPVADPPAPRPKPVQPDAWDLAGAWLAQHGALPALALISIAIACIHWHILWGEPAGDDLSFHFAESARIADCLRSLDFDLWNPSANGGYASAYYYQVLPQLVSAVPTALFGHHQFFFSLSVILPLVFAPACAYRGMRLLGATPWQATMGAFVIAFMNGESRWGAGSAGTFNVGLYTQTWALCIFPIALGHGARWIREGKGLAPSIGWGGAAFLCHPFAGISLGVAFVIAFLCKFAVTWRLWRSPTMLGVIAIYLGGGPLLALVALKVVPLGGATVPGAAIGATAALAILGIALVVRFHRTDQSWAHESVRQLNAELHRLAILGVTLMITTAPVLLPLAIDGSGFGGFPHRVGDEVGPGFGGLWTWAHKGAIMDFMPKDQPMRLPLLTLAVPVILGWTIYRPLQASRWLWPPAILYALWLGIGPHAGKVGDDLLPAVRALGAMQTVIGLAIGAGALSLGKALWDADWDRGLTRLKTMPAPLRVLVILMAVGVVLDLVSGAILAAVVGAGLLFGVLVGSNGVRQLLRGVAVLLIALTALLFVIVIATGSVASGLLMLVTFVGLGVPAFYYYTLGRDDVREWMVRASVDDHQRVDPDDVSPTLYGVRTALAAIAASMIVLIAYPGSRALLARVRTLQDYGPARTEMMQINTLLGGLPQGRHQPGPGAENHWWNSTPYIYDRVPTTLQMGGGGLQASPNYDALWTMRDYAKNAWIFDAPYLTFERSRGAGLPEGEMLARTDKYEIRRLNSPGIVSPVQVVGVLPPGDRVQQMGHIAALAWLKSTMPTNNQVLAYVGSGGVGPAPQGRTLRAWRQDSPGSDADIVAEVEATGPTTFWVHESWHPRWHAFVDGAEVPVRRVTPDFPAVDVGPGKHTIELRFERPLWLLLAWLAWPGAAILAWLGVRRFDRRRRRLPEVRVV